MSKKNLHGKQTSYHMLHFIGAQTDYPAFSRTESDNQA